MPSWIDGGWIDGGGSGSAYDLLVRAASVLTDAETMPIHSQLVGDQDRTLSLIGAATAGKVSGAETNTVVFRDIDDTVNAITATVDEHGNRTSLTYGV